MNKTDFVKRTAQKGFQVGLFLLSMFWAMSVSASDKGFCYQKHLSY